MADTNSIRIHSSAHTPISYLSKEERQKEEGVTPGVQDPALATERRINPFRNTQEVHPAVLQALEEESDKRLGKKKGFSTEFLGEKGKKGGLFLEKPDLPRPEAEKSDKINCFDELGKAYAAIIKSSSKSSEFMMSDYGALQENDMITAEIMLINSNKAMAKQKEAIEDQEELYQKQKSSETLGSLFRYLSLGVTAAAVLLTMGAALPAAFATYAATEATELAAVAIGEATGELALGAGTEATSAYLASEAASAAAATEVGAGSASTAAVDASIAAASDAAASSSTVATYKLISEKIISLTVTALGMTSMTYDGVIKIQLSQILDRLADCQGEVKEPLSTTKACESYLRFYQHGLDRDSTILQSLAEEEGSLIETATGSISVYKQITEGLCRRG